mgnify:CR=1 FL=1
MITIKNTKIALYISTAIASVGAALSVIQHFAMGSQVNILAIGLIYGVIAYGFYAVKKEEKAIKEEMKEFSKAA